MRKIWLPLLLLPLLVAFVIYSEDSSNIKKASTNLKEGDIVFQSGNSSQCIAVKLATHSKFSHVGIVVKHEGELKVLEAVEPVLIIALDKWIRQGEKGKYEAKRLKDTTLLTSAVKQAMIAEGKSMLNKHYDLYFGWDDSQIYCSELVYKIYERGGGITLCELNPLSSYDLTHPAVKNKLKERYGDNIPMDEPMVSPEDIYQSDLLISVD